MQEKHFPHAPTSAPSPERPEQVLASLWPVGELIQYLCFVVVAEELHFTRAAVRLHLDQSALSRHIQKLESSLGTKLFVRGERKVSLTEPGTALVPFARKALNAVNAGARITRAVGRGEPEQFEVAYSAPADVRLIVRIKELVQSAHPAISVHFRSVPPEQLVARLLAGASQAGIAILPIEEDLGIACIQREELFVVAPATHDFAERFQIALHEIADQPVIWVAGAGQAPFTKHMFGLFRRAGFVPNVVQEVQTIAEGIGLAREGLGMTFVKAADRHLAGAGLAVIPLATGLFVETGLLYLNERRWDVLNRFVSLVSSRFRCDNEDPSA